jgi:anti-sigma regulatory factor (Ser/Thr protein kinase)
VRVELASVGGTGSELSLDLELPAVPESCPRARRAVRDALEPLGVDVGAVELAVSEAVANAVVHAYRDREPGDPGPVHIAVAIDTVSALVTVTDEGCGMRPRPDSPGLGFGLSLMATACDHLEIEQSDAGTRVHMRFATGAVVRR